METPARTDLANAVRALLLEAPGGLSVSALGLRLRRSDPAAVDAFLEEAGPGETKPALQGLCRSIPGVISQTKGGSEFYSINKKPDAFQGLFRDDDRSTPPSSGSGPPSRNRRNEEPQFP